MKFIIGMLFGGYYCLQYSRYKVCLDNFSAFLGLSSAKIRVLFEKSK
jgi:hypothetical protein